MDQPKHCVFALGHLNHQGIDNKISACFRCSAFLGRYDQDLMSEVVNGAAARKHRMKLMRGEWPVGCRSCQEFEEQGVLSTRLNGLYSKDVNELLKNYDPDTGMVKHIKSIELRFGNECNLTCRHCGPDFSSRWEALERLDRTITQKGLGRQDVSHNYHTRPEYFKDILENIVPNLNEIMFSGGETLYQKEHYDFINAIPSEHAAHIQLFYVTNGTVTGIKNHNAFEMWKRFKEIKIIVSTDGVGEQYEYFRQGAKWDNVEKNIRLFIEQGYAVSTEITCSVYQMFYLTDTLDYLYDNKICQSISSSTVQYPTLVNQRIMPLHVKQEIAEQIGRWLDGIKDQTKMREVGRIAQRQLNYMMGNNDDIYNPDDPLPTWDDFSESVRLLDRVFKTSADVSFPRMAKHLTR